MPNSITSVSPQVQMTGLRNVPKYDPFLGLREAMLMQRAMQAAARRGGGGGGSSVEGNPRYGYWVELPNGERKWAYGTSDKGRKESEAKIWADYRNRVLSADPEYKKATEGLASLSIPGQRERIDELKKMAPRLAPTLGLSEIDTVKYLTADADKNVKARETEVNKAPGEFFASLGRGALDLWDSIAQIADTAPEQLARARASNAREREAAESNAFLDEIHRLEQEGRSSAGMRYGTLRGLRNLAGESLSSLGAMVAAQSGGAAAGAALGSAIAPGPGTLAGAIGGVLGGAAGGIATGGPMGSFQFARSIADDDTISEADKIRMLEDNNAGLYGALAGGAFGAIPGGVVGLAGKGLVRVPGRIGQTAAVFQIPSDTVRGAVARGIAQNAVDAAAVGAGFTVAGNQAYREATGRDIPLTAGLGDAIIGGALLGLPFGAARGFGVKARRAAWEDANRVTIESAEPVEMLALPEGRVRGNWGDPASGDPIVMGYTQDLGEPRWVRGQQPLLAGGGPFTQQSELGWRPFTRALPPEYTGPLTTPNWVPPTRPFTDITPVPTNDPRWMRIANRQWRRGETLATGAKPIVIDRLGTFDTPALGTADIALNLPVPSAAIPMRGTLPPISGRAIRAGAGSVVNRAPVIGFRNGVRAELPAGDPILGRVNSDPRLRQLLTEYLQDRQIDTRARRGETPVVTPGKTSALGDWATALGAFVRPNSESLTRFLTGLRQPADNRGLQPYRGLVQKPKERQTLDVQSAKNVKELQRRLQNTSDLDALATALDSLSPKNWKRKYIEARIGELTNGDAATGADSSLIGQAPRLEPAGPEGERRADNPDNPPGGPAAAPAEATATAAPDQVPGAPGGSRPADEIGGPNGTRPPDTGENTKAEAAPDEQGVSGAKIPDGESDTSPTTPASSATGESAGGAELAERPGAGGAGDEPAVSAEQSVEPKPLDHAPVNAQEAEQVATLREDIADTPVEIRVQPTDTTEVAQAKVQKQLENGRRFETAEAEAEVLTRLSSTLSDAYDGAQTPAEIMSRVNFSFHEPTAEQIAKTVDRSLEQEAWHGTPNEIVGDQLSTDHIGSGEGAQVHGWGLYVAKRESVARGYQLRLSARNTEAEFTYKNSPVEKNTLLGRVLQSAGQDFADLAQVKMRLEKILSDTDDMVAFIQSAGSNFAVKSLLNMRRVKDVNELKAQVAIARELLDNFDQLQMRPQSKGQRLRLEIPEDSVMLREDAPFSEQPEAVQKVLKELATQALGNVQAEFGRSDLSWARSNSLGDAESILTRIKNAKTGTNIEDTGADIYRALSWAFGGDKGASLVLDKMGIKGIRYRGGTDGECAVLFDGKYARILERFYDQQGRGRIDFLNDGTARILFTDAADASTAIHEFQHFFLSEAGRLLSDPTVAESAAKQMLAKDIETLGRWAGEKENLSDPRTWSAEGHEKLAKAFEQYFREGKAPTPEMQSLFQKMKNFLVELYKKAKDLIGLSRLPKDIREVFDRELTGYKAEENPFDPTKKVARSMGGALSRLHEVPDEQLFKIMKYKPTREMTGYDVYNVVDDATKLIARKALGEKLKPAEEKQVKALLKAMDYDSIELPPGELVNIRKQYGKAKEQGLDVSEEELLTKKTEDAQRKVNDDPACGV